MNKKTVLKIKTSQVSALKQVFKILGNIFGDVNMVFSKTHDIESIKIMEKAEEHAVLVKVNLNTFDYFKCDEPEIIIGISVDHLCVALKMFNNYDRITLYMNGDKKSLYIRNSNKNHTSFKTTKIPVFNMNHKNLELCSKIFHDRLIIKSRTIRKLYKICEKNNLYNHVLVHDQVSFKCSPDDTTINISYTDDKKNDKNKSIKIDTENLMIFNECHKLCDKVQMYIDDDYPLVLKIPITYIGEMIVFINRKREHEGVYKNIFYEPRTMTSSVYKKEKIHERCRERI